MTELSPVQQTISALVQRHGRAAHAVLDAMLAERTNTELAAGLYDWSLFARPKQRVPGSRWRSFGLLTGRGFGKTRTLSEFVRSEIEAGRAGRVALIAQNEDKTLEVMIEGASGLIATAPPWFRPRMERGRLVYPNGAECFVYTPEVPGALRGPEHHLAWVSEVVVWPASTRDEAFSNLRLGLRLGQGRMVWDSTPKRRHPLIRYLLERARKHPELHVVVRGTTRENADNLTPEAIAEWEAEYGGTRRGQEELEGIFFDESDGALWQQEWIDKHRREMPGKFVRRCGAIDPAISMREGTDPTGFVEGGLTADGQAIVIQDLTDRIPWEEWGDTAVNMYVANRWDCIVIENNRGGDACAANIARAAKERGLTCVIYGPRHHPKHRAPHNPGTVVVLEVRAHKSKDARAEPVAGRYKAGRVSHVRGADLQELEDELTTWEPDGRHESPNRMDAAVYVVCELLGLYDDKPDPRKAFQGIVEANRELQRPQAGGSLAALIGGGGRGRTI